MRTMTAWFVSVRGRITLAVTALFAIVMALGAWFLLDRAEAALVNAIETQDRTQLERLAVDLQALDEVLGGVMLPVGVDGTSFTLIDDRGAVVGSTPPEMFGAGVIVADPGSLGELLAGRPPPPGLIAEVGGDVVTVSLPVVVGHGTYTLAASSSLEPARAGVNAFGDILLVVIPVLVAGVGAMTWFVTGRAFRPVADITGRVERITDGNLDERVPVPTTRDEVAQLARTMNRMLDRLSESRRRQRQFVSDASHELRNPVATSRVKLEVALAGDSDTDWVETSKVVLREQERLGALVDDLLLLTRLDEGQPVRHGDVDLDDIVFEEAARPHPVTVDVSEVEAVRVTGDRRQLMRLVRNLVDNAARHGVDRVGVSLSIDGDAAVLAVEDDGPGVPEQDRTVIFERFVRLEEARARDEGGSGLGLALVHAVTAAHGGTVRVTDAAQGGARFEVRLPRAAG